MMTEQYTQTVEVPSTNSDKAKLIIGIAFMMASLAFLIVAILKNKWFYIGFGALLVIGFVAVQLFESAASEYFYSISEKSFAVSKKNNAHSTKRMVCIPLESIIRVENFCDVQTDDDIVACPKISGNGVFSVVFEQNSQKISRKNNAIYGRLLIEPDEYMLALFKEKLSDKVAVGEDYQ